jgi:hypothetical protein
LDITPPAWSRISVDELAANPTLVIPHRAFAESRYFVPGIVLCGFGMFSLVAIAMYRDHGFDIILAAFWGVMALVCGNLLFRMLRPGVPERLVLEAGGVTYDSGVAPLRFPFACTDAARREFWHQCRGKRWRLRFDREVLATLALRETEAGNRLTIDYESERIDLARGVSEVEREWLYRVLVDRYGLGGTVPPPPPR